jgi:gamma-butyrobetaine dioxygenase
MFDVLSEPNAVDLSNTSVALGAHADMPYRRPVPGLQLLHALANEAPGGDSTLVDGFAAAEALRTSDPHGYETLCSLGIEFRYDIGTNAMTNTAPMIERDHAGKLRCVRFSPRIDYAPNADHATLDAFYRARRSLAEWVNSPAHRATFRLNAGDAMVFDNHRILHGRTAFDPTLGRRHLQGCYLDHDGLHTQWQLLQRTEGVAHVGEQR